MYIGGKQETLHERPLTLGVRSFRNCEGTLGWTAAGCCRPCCCCWRCWRWRAAISLGLAGALILLLPLFVAPPVWFLRYVWWCTNENRIYVPSLCLSLYVLMSSQTELCLCFTSAEKILGTSSLAGERNTVRCDELKIYTLMPQLILLVKLR